MLHTSKDVDKHVSDILARIKDENEKKSRGFNFARLYFQVKDYESAKRYLTNYLAVHDKHAVAYKLMGQIQEATGNLEHALQAYKRSLVLDSSQKDVVLKICDIYCNIPVDPETTRYWIERAQKLFPGHNVIFKLKEGIARGETDVKDLENLITSELLTRPNDVMLRVKLLRLLLNSGQVLEAHKHALQAEDQPHFRQQVLSSLDWQHCLADVFKACLEQNVGPADERFFTKYLLTLDVLAELSLSDFPVSPASVSSNGSSSSSDYGTEEDSIKAIGALDKLLEDVHQQQKWSCSGAWVFVLQHVTGQLYLHMATLVLKRSRKEGCNWQEVSRWVSALLLCAYARRPPSSLHQETWFPRLDQREQHQFEHVILRAQHRMSVSGHIVSLLCDEEKTRWLGKIKQEVCIPQVRQRIHCTFFRGEEHGSGGSWFLKDPFFVEGSLEFPTPSALQEYDNESQLLYPGLLNHLVWLALHHNRLSEKRSKVKSTFEVRVFRSLQRETPNLVGGTSESLSQMDTEAFLEATLKCASVALQRKSGGIPVSRGPLAVPPTVGIRLCTESQEQWWAAAHLLHTNAAGERLADLRRILQKGLEVIRAVGNHGMDLALVVHLARTFADKSSAKRDQGLEDESQALEGRAALYWQAVLSLLEGSTSRLGPARRLFGPLASQATSPQETRVLREEAKMFLAVRAMNAESLDEAMELLSGLTSAQAAYYSALVLKKMSQNEVGSIQQALLSQEKAALVLAVERSRKEPNQPFSRDIRHQFDDLDARLAEVNLSNGSLEEQSNILRWESPRRMTSGALLRGLQSSTPKVDRSFFQVHSSLEQESVAAQASSCQASPSRSRMRPVAASSSTAAELGTELLEMQLRSLSLQLELMTRTLGQMEETNRAVVSELRDVGRGAKEQNNLMEQLLKKMDDIATKMVSTRSQRHHEDAEYVDDYVSNYEADYDPYGDYSHLETGAGPSPIVGGVAPAPPPMGSYRGQPFGAYPPPPPLGYPMAPPPPLGRPLAPPLPPQAFYSPQAAAAAAAVAAPGLRLAEGQPLPQFTFDISQPPPPPGMATALPASEASRASAFSRLGAAAQPSSLASPVAAAAAVKSPNAPHAFQIPLPASFVGATAPTVTPTATAAATPTAGSKLTSSTPRLEGLLRDTGPTPATPEKKDPMTPVGTKTEALTQSPLGPRQSRRVSSSSDDHLEEAEVEGNFKPLIPLPEEVSICTGEENEKVCFEERAKLFRYVDKEWKERGIGTLKLLENKEGRVRLLMRREQVLKVCANHNINSTMVLTQMPGKDTAWIWDAQDFADGEARPEKFCVRFKTPEIASSFKEAFERAARKPQRPLSAVSSPAATQSPVAAVTTTATSTTWSSGVPSVPSTFGSAAALTAVSKQVFSSPIPAVVTVSSSPPTSLPSLPATGFGKMFHPKPGSWSCHVCYVSNEANKLTCAACDSPKPGTEKPKTLAPQTAPKTPASSISFGQLPSSVGTSTLSAPVFTFGVTMPEKSAPLMPVFGTSTVSQASSFGAAAAHEQKFSSPASAFGLAIPEQKSSPSVTTFGMTMPQQKEPITTPFGMAAAAMQMPTFGDVSAGKNVFGGFTFSSPPKVKDASREAVAPAPVPTTKAGPAKTSPFASFSFQSPQISKKDDTKETAPASFITDARSEISKINFLPSKPSTQASPQGQAKTPVPSPKAASKSTVSPGSVPEEFVPNVEFEPVVPLPELVEARTGEEDEEVLFCERAKLYRYDSETKQWKERGVGQLKVLRHSETRVCRILMRRDQVLKLCANHRILPEMQLGPMSTNDRSWSWFATDYSDGTLSHEQLAVRFKTKEQADSFKRIFDSCREEQQSQPKGKDRFSPRPASKEDDSQKSLESVPLSQLSEFKPKPGVWNCDVCYVTNPADRSACLACETPRPGTKPSVNTSSPLSALEKFASPGGNTGSGFFGGAAPPPAASAAKFTFGFQAAQAPASSKAPTGFVFGSGTQQSAGGAPTSTFTFGAASSQQSTSESTVATAPTGSAGAFKFGSPQKYEFSFSGLRKTPKSPGTPTDVEEEDYGTVESPEADIYFQPVVPLPPKVEVRTGEEEEELLYGHRAKLYRWLDGEWKERGLGDIKLLLNPATTRIRLLMRREPVLKVCLNHLVTPEIQLHKKDERVVFWSATDFSDGEPCPQQFALRLKTSQVADEFMAAVENAKARISNSPSGKTAVAKPSDSKPSSAAANFSFRLEDDSRLATPTPSANSFSLASRFGSPKQTVVRSLFGNTSPTKSDDGGEPVVVYQAAASPEQVARARELQLPDSFYLYETKPPCPGCRGCEDWDAKKGQRFPFGTAKGVVAPSVATAPTVAAAPSVAAADSTTSSKEDEAEGSLFSKSSVMKFSFAELAQKSSTSSGFGQPTTSPKAAVPLLAGAGTKLFQSTAQRKTSEGDDDGDVAPSADIHFEPVVPLPDLVELRTGEEEEGVLFCHRAKLYIYRPEVKQWKERAIGDIKILKKLSKPFTSRVVMRRDQVHKIACNHAITKITTLAPLSTSSNSLTWTAIDYTEGKPSPESFAVRFKNPEVMDEFKRIFNECQQEAQEKEDECREGHTGRNGEQDEAEQSSRECEEEEEEEEEDEDEDDDDDHAEDIMFEKRVSLAIMGPGKDSYQPAGMGNLRMVYDDSCYGVRIQVFPDKEGEKPLCNTLIAVQTCLRTERLHAFWTAVDTSREPLERHHYRATFSSSQAVEEFRHAFDEGKDVAIQSAIVETVDESPSRPK